MKSKNAFETVKEIVRNKVAVMNLYEKQDDCNAETVERFRNELSGMMICLKSITPDDTFYCINYYETGYEFGYYDKNHNWISIEK